MTGMNWRSRIGAVAVGALLAFAGWTALSPAPAEARVFIGIGVPFPGYGYPCCGYPYPYGYGYPPPPPAYYYPPPASPYPPAAYAPPAAPAPAATAQPAAITYTDRPAFRNASGQTCREFKTASNTLGTACQDTSGQWRVQN
ncbi:MAG TPA: hypothetical protein VFW46_02670 [Stellaceae bacterium]|nr:hypothetical protein [Stellaceae bacterium]